MNSSAVDEGKPLDFCRIANSIRSGNSITWQEGRKHADHSAWTWASSRQGVSEINRETKTESTVKYDETAFPVLPLNTSKPRTIKWVPGRPTPTRWLAPLVESISRTKENEYAVGSRPMMLLRWLKPQECLATVYISKLSETNANQMVTWKPREQNELDEIRSIVSSALGITNSTHISIASFRPLEDPRSKQLDIFQKRLKREEWIDIGKQFSIVGLAVFMLWWFTRTLKKTPFEPIPLGIPLEDLRDYAYETDPNAPQEADATEKMATTVIARTGRTRGSHESDHSKQSFQHESGHSVVAQTGKQSKQFVLIHGRKRYHHPLSRVASMNKFQLAAYGHSWARQRC